MSVLWHVLAGNKQLTYCPSEAEAGGLVGVGVSGQPGLHNKFQASKDYVVKPTLKRLNYGLWTFFGAESWRLARGMNTVLLTEDFMASPSLHLLLLNKTKILLKERMMSCLYPWIATEEVIMLKGSLYISSGETSLKERKNPNQD